MVELLLDAKAAAPRGEDLAAKDMVLSIWLETREVSEDKI